MNENEQVKQGNINDLIKIINKANDNFSYEIYIPSLEKNVLFREINTAQQKKLVKSIIDSPVFNTEFIFALKSIIEENCADNTVNVNELTIYDKLLIAINMRIYSISDDLIINLNCPDCDKEYPMNIKLSELLNNVKEQINIELTKTIQDETKTFTVFCEIPTIATEYNLENEFRRNTKIEVKDEQELRETIGNVFIGELVKYISKIDIKDGDKSIELNLNTMKFKDRIKLIETLNVKLLKQIVDYISSIKEQFDKIYMVKTKCDCEKSTDLQQRFSIDSNFFIVS
jgi:thiol-disulfide isomerase/thioredoxin